MFLSQEIRYIMPTFRSSNFARIPQVGINPPEYFTRTLGTYYGICRPQGNGRLQSKPRVLHRSGVTVEDTFVNSTRCNFTFCSVSGQVIRPWRSTVGLKLASLQTLEFTLFPHPRMNNRKPSDLLHLSECLFTRGSSTDVFLSRALSTGTKQKQVTWVNGRGAIKDKKLQSSKNLQGEADKPDSEEKQSKAKQLKKIFKEYGAVGVSFHIGISLISLGIFYLSLSSGINMAALLCKLGFSESVVQSKMAAGTSTFVLAYALHKLFAPLRISITLVSVPLIVRYFRKTGLFKPPSSGL